LKQFRKKRRNIIHRASVLFEKAVAPWDSRALFVESRETYQLQLFTQKASKGAENNHETEKQGE
jgi:hypothetical protein